MRIFPRNTSELEERAMLRRFTAIAEQIKAEDDLVLYGRPSENIYRPSPEVEPSKLTRWQRLRKWLSSLGSFQ